MRPAPPLVSGELTLQPVSLLILIPAAIFIEITVFIKVTAELHDTGRSPLPADLAAVSNQFALAAELDAAPFVSAETQNTNIFNFKLLNF